MSDFKTIIIRIIEQFFGFRGLWMMGLLISGALKSSILKKGAAHFHPITFINPVFDRVTA